jgi:hypothetical protein
MCGFWLVPQPGPNLFAQNKDVLAHVTIPNVVLNWSHEGRAVDSAFFAGDWANMTVG